MIDNKNEFAGAVSTLACGQNVRLELPLGLFWLKAIEAGWLQEGAGWVSGVAIMANPTLLGRSVFVSIAKMMPDPLEGEEPKQAAVSEGMQ